MKCDSDQAIASDVGGIASTCIPTRWGVFQALGFEREIVNDDGTMARVPDLIRLCKRHNLEMITVS